MSWLTYAIRSTIRTILPSCVSGSRGPVCVRIPSRTSWVRLSRSRDPERLLVVPEPRAEPLAQRLVERLLAGMPERRVPRVVAEPDRLDEILVQPERPRDDARDRGRLERVGHPRAVVVALGVDEDLRLPLQPAKRLRVDDPVAVALERRPHAARLLGPLAPPRLVRADGERRQPRLLALPDKEPKLRDAPVDVSIASRVIAAAALDAVVRRAASRRLRTSATGRRRSSTQVPTTHDARGETRNATTSAISSTVPKRPHGQLALDECGDPLWILPLTRRSQLPPGKQRRAGRDAEDADPVLREVARPSPSRG